MNKEKVEEWIINEPFDLYDLDKGEITVKDIFREEFTICKGQSVTIGVEEYNFMDYLIFCDRNNQLVYKRTKK